MKVACIIDILKHNPVLNNGCSFSFNKRILVWFILPEKHLGQGHSQASLPSKDESVMAKA